MVREGQFGADRVRGGDQVPQGRFDLGVTAGLQTAVRVDPDPLGGHGADGGPQQPADLVDAGNARRVDVVHTRPDAAAEARRAEVGDDLHLRPRGLDAGDVGVERVDRLDHLTELRVAHVRVDLCRVVDAGRRQPERRDRPREVRLVGRGAQREKLPQCRLVDLDDADARRLQVVHLVADGQCHLTGGLAQRLVVADERPRQDRHRPGQHPLDGFAGQALRVARPLDGHRLRTRDVAVQDRRPDTARAVGLHPAEVGGGEPGQPLGEVLHHVVALGLAVHQHVQAEVLLQPDDALDLRLHRGFVPGVVQRTRLVRGAGLADVGGLRERADRGARQGRQGQRGLLGGRTLRVGRADGVLRAQCLQPGTHAGVGQVGRRRAVRGRGTGGGKVDAILLQRPAEQDDLIDLLLGEREPALETRVEFGLPLDVVGHVQQRARRRDADRLRGAEQRRRPAERAGRVGAPDVAPVDHSGQDLLVAQGGLGRDSVHKGLIGDEVDGEGVDRGAGEHTQPAAEAAEVPGDQDLRPRGLLREPVVRADERVEFLLGAVGGEGGLVELDPLDAFVVQAPQQFDVAVEEVVEQVQRAEALRCAF